MKRFNGPVVFEGTLKGVTTDSLMDGMAAKVEFEMPRVAGVD
jgi:hypothetical protein